MKRVRVMIEMDNEFVGLLRAQEGVSEWHDKDQLTPAAQLALIVLAEARGALEPEVDALVLPCWRPHLDVLHAARQVFKDSRGARRDALPLETALREAVAMLRWFQEHYGGGEPAADAIVRGEAALKAARE